MKNRKVKINDHLKEEILNTFFQTFFDLKSEDLEIFLKDLLSAEELQLLSKRLAIAYWLKKGREIKNIKENLKVSLKEVNEVRRKLNTLGYQLALKNLEADEWANKWSDKIKNFYFSK